MIFNQQALLLYGTESSEQKTMILIQGKRAIYFKYFCRMAEVIYSVIIRHIVKWTIVKRVILSGFYELHGTLLYDLLLSRHRSLSQKLIYEPEKNESWNRACSLLHPENGFSFLLSWKETATASVYIRELFGCEMEWIWFNSKSWKKSQDVQPRGNYLCIFSEPWKLQKKNVLWDCINRSIGNRLLEVIDRWEFLLSFSRY